jgi:hypothetical protein
LLLLRMDSTCCGRRCCFRRRVSRYCSRKSNEPHAALCRSHRSASRPACFACRFVPVEALVALPRRPAPQVRIARPAFTHTHTRPRGPGLVGSKPRRHVSCRALSSILYLCPEEPPEYYTGARKRLFYYPPQFPCDKAQIIYQDRLGTRLREVEKRRFAAQRSCARTTSASCTAA